MERFERFINRGSWVVIVIAVLYFGLHALRVFGVIQRT